MRNSEYIHIHDYFFVITLLVVNFLYGLFSYLSTIEFLTGTELDSNEVKEISYLQFRGKSIFEVASNPLSNMMIFDRKYLSHDIGDQLKMVLTKGSSGCRRMIYSMIGIFLMFFLSIFLIN